jgi:hypothetical protein
MSRRNSSSKNIFYLKVGSEILSVDHLIFAEMPRSKPKCRLLTTGGNLNKFWKLRRNAISVQSVWVNGLPVDVFRVYDRVGFASLSPLGVACRQGFGRT